MLPPLKFKNERHILHPAPMAHHLDPTRRQDTNTVSVRKVAPVRPKPARPGARMDTLTAGMRKVGPVMPRVGVSPRVRPGIRRRFNKII